MIELFDDKATDRVIFLGFQRQPQGIVDIVELDGAFNAVLTVRELPDPVFFEKEQ